MTAQWVGLLLGQWPEYVRGGARGQAAAVYTAYIEVYPPLPFLASKGGI